MPDVNELNVHDVNVRDEVATGNADFGKTFTVLTFFVGSHGPFRERIPKDQATGEKINSLIDTQVANLRRVTGIGY
jgi:hypothetical protein